MSLSCRFVLVVALLASPAIFAQDAPSLVSRIEGVTYPRLARQMMLQGDVRLRSGTDGVIANGGYNPILSEIAVNSLKAIGKISDREIEATYHFVLVESKEIRITKKNVPRG